jgi:uncharacterized protein YndB with AHSA1/START domain
MFGCAIPQLIPTAIAASTLPLSSTVAARTTRPLLVMTRVFDAPRADVFAEWSAPDRLARWWQVRPDGRRRPDIDRFEVTILALCPLERIVFAWGGHRAETTTLISITLTDEGAGTRWTLEQSV